MSSEAKEAYLASLNPPQYEGVINTEGPTMIIAGAGSGKTRVLTYRIAYLLKETRIDAFNIMALTFTNKAAREMRNRIEGLVGNDARNLWMGTFHSVFARILRAEASKLGYTSNFTIYDTDDSKSLIKTIVKELGLDDKLYKANVVYNRISSAKNRLVSWKEYTENPIYMEDDAANQRPEMGRLYRIYSQRCYKSDAMDFDDLLFNTNILFQEHLDVLNKYQQRFHYVLIDEFQDTNISQYMIAKKLAAVRQNICVVGDDAQSIYAFRGADIQNILNFERDYPELKVIKLEQNYRSTKTIVEAANSVIAQNKAQLQKSVWTSNDDGDLIELIKATSDNEEGKLVASSIFETKMQDHASSNDFAILYRTNSQSRALEEALRRNNLKYRVVGGLSFYQRREIKDLIGYIRFVLNPNDEASLRRIINLPKRGIGPGTVEKLFVASEEHEKPVWEIIQKAKSYMGGGRAANQISDFATLIKSFQLTLEKKDAYEAALHIAKTSGLLKDLYEDKTVEGLNRYENVQELLNAIKEFVDDSEREEHSLNAFLQDVALLTDEDRNEKTEDAITLMTIHMAKGLEFPYVYVVGLEEELFPSQMMLSSRADLEEERRLFYVAITRAKKKLTLSYALNRYRFGRLKNCEPSRFLEDVDTRYIKINKKFGSRDVVSPSNNYVTKNFVNNIKSDPARKFTAAPKHTPSPDFKPSDTANLKVGHKIEHPKFGFGKVVTMDEEGSNRKARIKFEKAGEKTLLLAFAKLRILD